MRTFTLQDFQAAKEQQIQSFSSANKHPFDKIRQTLQYLRNDGIISFDEEKRGTYTLRYPEVLDNELVDPSIVPLHKFEPQKREYTREIYARDRGWVKQAKERYGHYCLHPACNNSFQKDDGLPYIEVHHIVPLFEGGEDGLWNLAVVCAHHHKMAHFADVVTRERFKELLLKIVEKL